VPFCWWDADGKAIANDWTGLSGLDIEQSVAVAVEHSASETAAQRTLDRYVPESNAYVVPDGTSRFDVWVGDGPWTEQPIAVGDEARLSDGVVRFDKAEDLSNMTLGVINGDLGPDVEVWLDAVAKDGKRHIDRDSRAVRLVHRDTPRWAGESENLRVQAAAVDHYVLRWRLRQRATFEGFAVEPTAKPPEGVGGDRSVVRDDATSSSCATLRDLLVEEAKTGGDPSEYRRMTAVVSSALASRATSAARRTGHRTCPVRR
jgi:hypothetical protein